MTKTQIEFRKKREIGDVFTDSFKFLKLEIKPLTRLMGIYAFPFIILYGIVQVYIQKNILGNIDLSDMGNVMSNMGPLYLNIFLFSLFGLFIQALVIATFYTYIEAYVKKGKGNFELSDITPQLFNNGLLAIGASLAVYVMVLFGLILCIVPGIYFANTLSPAIIILLFERKGIAAALTRSAFLVNRQWWNTFLINIVGLIIIWTVSFVFSIPGMLAGFSISLTNPVTTPLDYPNWYWVLSGISTIVSSVFYIIPYTLIAFQYFNLDEITKPEGLSDIQR
ncbi:MAG TPA: hypothetical protein DER09_02760 [Prolixibacteraceae bacterium]|nr:hypothetical protein [Prolixibacteraceae bacterium]